MPSVPPDPARLAQAPDPGLGARVSVQLERTVDAPIERVWALLRDYRLARPRLLTAHFSDYADHHGGEGAGTVLEYQLRVGRHHGRHLLAVQEPAAGRMLPRARPRLGTGQHVDADPGRRGRALRAAPRARAARP